MHHKRLPYSIVTLFVFMSPGSVWSKEPKLAQPDVSYARVLWQDPADITSRDLFYGPGGEKDAPHGPFTFEKEDLEGTNPKFVVHDADGTKWKVKLGEEARPETVASRLVWAAGYFADEDYFLADIKIDGMPTHLHRGAGQFASDGSTHNVRLKRYLKDEKKVGTWQWLSNPFSGTRELNGLRVVMALLDNWDLKDVNNAIYNRPGVQIYLISDLGASFGPTGRKVTRAESKGNEGAYDDSRFISHVGPDSVDFRTPSRPALIHMFELPEYVQRLHMEWIGKDIPRSDAKWIGDILSRLSPEQVQAAFRAAGYSPEQVQGFSDELRERIGALTRL